MPDGKVTFQVEVDANGAKKSIDQIVNEFKDAGVKVDKVTENMGSDMSKSFSKAFDIERVKNFAIQAAKTIAQLGKDAIAAASDLQEVQNVVDATFGDSAGQINSWAQNAGKQFGLTDTGKTVCVYAGRDDEKRGHGRTGDNGNVNKARRAGG